MVAGDQHPVFIGLRVSLHPVRIVDLRLLVDICRIVALRRRSLPIHTDHLVGAVVEIQRHHAVTGRKVPLRIVSRIAVIVLPQLIRCLVFPQCTEEHFVIINIDHAVFNSLDIAPKLILHIIQGIIGNIPRLLVNHVGADVEKQHCLQDQRHQSTQNTNKQYFVPHASSDRNFSNHPLSFLDRLTQQKAGSVLFFCAAIS